MSIRDKLSERERRFVAAFLGPSAGNATQAAKAAGYSRPNARPQASRLLTKANIQRAIAARVGQLEARGVADATERDLLLSRFARDARHSVRDRIRAIVELNKCSGRHSLKHLVEGTLTLEQVLTQSREPTQ